MTGHNGSGRVALITGAGSGIGRATALRLAADGYRVALLGRRAHALKETAADVHGDDRALVLPCDVTHHAAVAATVATVSETFGRIDVLVNNAGISATAPFADVALQRWREVMAVDARVRGRRDPSRAARAAGAPRLRRQRRVTGRARRRPQDDDLQRGQGRGGQPHPLAGRRACAATATTACLVAA
jgi:NAD(P)-dependent dehydrogenase (short-subunit alcohol dehydrogenase family)